MSFTIDMFSTRELEAELELVKKKSFPYATRHALNQTAWQARQEWRDQIGEKFIERNKWTRNSIRVETARTLDADRQESAVGSLAPYMETQEQGGVNRPKPGSKSVPIPTSYSAGQEGAAPRTRLTRPSNRLKRLKAQERVMGKNKKQRLVIAVNEAVRSKRRVFISRPNDFDIKPGIFRVIGGRYTGRGWPRGAKIKMIHRLTKNTIRIKPAPTMSPSVAKASKQLEENYREALLFQLRRLGIK